MTRDEILAFAREFDPQPFHLDEEAAAGSFFGGLAASGWRGTAEIDDGGGGYTHAGLALAIGAALGRRPRLVRPPLPLLRVAAGLDTAWATARGRLPTLSRGRVATFAHPDWVATAGRGLPAALWRPAIDLSTGLARTVAWYRAQGWLR